jgi:hypothetical protein
VFGTNPTVYSVLHYKTQCCKGHIRSARLRCWLGGTCTIKTIVG